MSIVIVLLFPLHLSTAQDDCTPKTCSKHSPTIRFPFRLKDSQPPHCGYPGFDLSCSPTTSATLLNLPFSIQVLVTNIDYKSQFIHIKDPNSYLPQQLQNLNLSTTPFQFCRFRVQPCLSGDGHEVYAESSGMSIYYPTQLISCRKMYNVWSVPYEAFDQTADLQLTWPQRVCGKCEAEGMFCGFMINSTGDEFDCFNPPKKILNNTKGNGEEFINEVGIIGTIHHVNVVRLVGYCADGFRRALIYEFLPNNSLEKFTISDRDKHLLGWKKLLEIAMGIAKGIDLHQGCDQQILHFDIKPHNILLDENLNPKIMNFGLAKLCSKEQSVVSMTTACGTIGYIAPEVFSRNFGNVSYKLDIYSFGMLLEMVGGKKNFDVMVNSTNQIYFPEWIYNRLDSGEELGIRIQDEGDAKIAKKLAIMGLWCIQWYLVDRPSMYVVIQMLEGDGDTVIKPPNPFVSANPPRVTGQASRRTLNNELETLVECE
ncbi:hypothetical protein RHSIM_Rhsim03G0203600 [Rhododendron simsii]|uniref:Protein kinase domain-containing protein n=1 Tax=Rhododendron simsii TaxID=118357 RepID=A0A834H5H3_RHOSS|nr:hypothetical protein RHSIM_Rhsim03G0203600 [Rhododendron simsii]